MINHCSSDPICKIQTNTTSRNGTKLKAIATNCYAREVHDTQKAKTTGEVLGQTEATKMHSGVIQIPIAT
jgi:hypothetical protein